MKIINTDVRGWKHEQGQYITGEGLVLSKKQVKEQCEYSAVPTTLVNIDERLGLDVALQVLRATSPCHGRRETGLVGSRPSEQVHS